VGLPVAVVLIVFAIANREFVRVSLDPLSPSDPWIALEMPLWALLYAGLFLGLVIGWVGAWVKQRRWRKAAREARSELDRLKARSHREDRLTAFDG
jgi:uncharacterized integral membrane protein